MSIHSLFNTYYELPTHGGRVLQHKDATLYMNSHRIFALVHTGGGSSKRPKTEAGVSRLVKEVCVRLTERKMLAHHLVVVVVVGIKVVSRLVRDHGVGLELGECCATR